MTASPMRPRLRILLVHNRYMNPGGEDVVLEAERDLLLRFGHAVDVFTRQNEDIRGLAGNVGAALTAAYNPSTRAAFEKSIADFGPDVVHAHNLFPVISPSIYNACNAARIPVVQTLHNYRLLCLSANLYRDGKVCEACVGQVPIQGVRHRCYRGSAAGSAAVATAFQANWWMGTWNKRVDLYIAPTAFAREKFIEGGLRPESVRVKPHFVNLDLDHPAKGPRDLGALYVGRLVKEKGVTTLLEAWRGLTVPLRIVGSGPLADAVRAEGNPWVEYCGQLDRRDIPALMRRSRFLIVPSEWFETFGLVIIEAMSAGLPVIASRLGAMGELVSHETNGLLFTAGNVDELRARVTWAWENPEAMRAMGADGRARAGRLYSPSANHDALLSIYSEAMAGAARRRA